jgi:ketosteroid isomerase-like protein
MNASTNIPGSDMKNILIALCGLAALSLSFAAAPAASGKSAGEGATILELDKQWYAMRIARDVAAIDNLLSDDVTITNSYGRVFTKNQLLERYRSPEPFFKLKDSQTEDVKLRIYGDAAVVTGHASVDGEGPDGRVVTSVRFTRTYAKIDRRWRLVAQQVTRIIR